MANSTTQMRYQWKRNKTHTAFYVCELFYAFVMCMWCGRMSLCESFCMSAVICELCRERWRARVSEEIDDNFWLFHQGISFPIAAAPLPTSLPPAFIHIANLFGKELFV